MEPDEIQTTEGMMTNIYSDHNGVIVGHITTEGKPYNKGHDYRIYLEDFDEEGGYTILGQLSFQNGPVKEVGVNGIINEALLAILKHRLTIINATIHSEDNIEAMTHIDQALEALERRTKNRIERGVEGTKQV